MGIEEMIKSVGKKTFVEYFEYFRNPQISVAEIKHEMQLRENYAQKSLSTKASSGKRIFREHLERDVLMVVINSARVDEETRREATRLLNEY